MRNDENAWTGRFTCTAEVDEYLGGDTITCLVCMRSGFGMLGSHLSVQHSTGASEYKTRFGLPDRTHLAGRPERERRSAKAREKRRAAVPPVGHDGNAWTGKFTCTDEVRAYIADDTVHCLLCWQSGFQNLTSHLRYRHGVETGDYKKRYGIPARYGVSGRISREKMAAVSRGAGTARKIVELQHRPVDWEAYLARLRAGDHVRSVLSTDGMPNNGQVARRRRSDPEFDAAHVEALRHRSGARIHADEIALATTAVEAGKYLFQIRQEVPTLSKSRLLRIKQLVFADQVIAARLAPLWGRRRPGITAEERNAQRRAIRLSTAADRFAPFRAQEQFRQALRSDEIYAAVNQAVPKNLPPEMRDDIVSDLIVGLLDGEFGVADLPREVGRARTAFNRMFGGYAPSLDAPIGDGGFTLNDSMVAAYI